MTLSRSNPRAKPRWMILVMTVAAGVLVMASVAMGATWGSGFEIDGNLAVDEFGNIDWNSFTDQTTATAFGFKFQPDADQSSTDVTYAGGQKHDHACPNLTTGKAHVKSDFTRFYFATEEHDGDTYLYLAWQRTAQNNDTNSAHASFIFAQSESLCPNGTTPVRTPLDMLITYDFQGGSTGVATVGLSRWIAAGTVLNGSPVTSAASCETSKSLPCWSKVVNLSAQGIGEGAVNHRGIGPVEDALQGKTLGVVEFGEAAVNLTAANVFPAEEGCISFGSAHVASRASGNSFDATLKDLVEPLDVELGRCGGLTIKKITDPSGDTATEFGFTVEGPEFDPNGDEFDLRDGQSKSYTDILAGEYTIAEDDPTADGYDLTAISCVSDDAPNTALGSPKVVVDLDERSVSVNLEVDDAITCTFTNSLQTHKVIVIVCHEADDTLAPSEYWLSDDENETLTSIDSSAASGFDEDLEEFLCGLDGFGGLHHDEVDLTVDVGSDAHP